MARRIAGFSLIELSLTIFLLGILSLPIGGMVVEHLRASIQGDDTVAAENLARYEHERLVGLSFNQLGDWCSMPQSQLPASEAWCPASVSGPNPYAALPHAVTRRVVTQTPTDNSSASMKRVTVRVFRPALSPASLIAMTTFVTDDVSFGGLQ